MSLYLFISICVALIFFIAWMVNSVRLKKTQQNLTQLREKFEAKELDWDRLNKASGELNHQLKLLDSEKAKLEKEKENSKEKSRKMWAMNEAVYKEKKRVDEELEKLNEEKLKLEQAKSKLDDKVKKLWATSTAVHKEKERINILKQEIELKHQEIVDSVTYAQRIQEAILPSRTEIEAFIPDSFILFKPRDIVSGDFYWFSKKETEIVLACVDCTGHGVPGAFMSMIGNTLLNQIVNERNILQPSIILNELNREITNSLKQGSAGSDSRDGMDIAVVTINPEQRTLQYAGANRPLYLFRNGAFTETKANKDAIGGHAFDYEKNFQNHVFDLHPGDTIYLSTDGFADQFNASDKKLMTKRFKEILLNVQHLSMPEQEKYLGQFITEWRGIMEQTDDILVIGVRM